MMLRFSSGSLTPRSAVQTASDNVVSVVTTASSYANLWGAARTREPPYRAAPPLGDAPVDTPRHRPHAGDGESPRPPAFPRQQLAEFGDRVGAGEHPAIGKHQVHRRRERRQRDAEARHG